MPAAISVFDAYASAMPYKLPVWYASTAASRVTSQQTVKECLTILRALVRWGVDFLC
jgi:hypothetical protein